MKAISLLFLLFSIQAFTSDQSIFSGTYSVPVQSDELRPYSKIQVSNIKFSLDALSFALPLEIASTKTSTITFERSEDSSNIFRSAFGEANCLQNKKNQIRCDLKYNKIYANFLKASLPDTKTFLHELNLPAEEIKSRIEIAKAFSGDPIGFLLINLN